MFNIIRKNRISHLANWKVSAIWRTYRWLPYFNEQKQKAELIQNLIAQTDKEIDEMVYRLYELTDEEKAIISA